jgi:SAM-dependent methyltransferase
VRGVDVSQRMLAVARERLAAADDDLRARLSFVECALEHYADADDTYDVVVAGLVLHYVRDVAPLLRAVRRWLKPGGALVFSTEHPICTSAQGLHPAYVIDNDHQPPQQPPQDHQQDHQQQPKQHKYYVYDRYHEEGERRATWFVDGVVRYHRTMASWVNGLVAAGFVVDRLLEPRPTADALAAFPDLRPFDQRRVIFLCVRALKPTSSSSTPTSSS